MSDSISSAIELLKADLASSEARIGAIREELAAARAGHAELKRALKALIGLGAGSVGLTREQVRPLVANVVEDNPGIAYADLYDLVREKLSARGQSANGLGLRVKEILAEEGKTRSLDAAFQGA